MGTKPYARLFPFLLITASACAGMPASPSTTPEGLWGGDHISMTVTATGARIELDCAHGDIFVRLPAAPFSVAGTFVREHGGPIRDGEIPNSRPAVYSASSSADKMTLTVRITDTNEMIGTFTLTRGVSGRVVKCL